MNFNLGNINELLKDLSFPLIWVIIEGLIFTGKRLAEGKSWRKWRNRLFQSEPLFLYLECDLLIILCLSISCYCRKQSFCPVNLIIRHFSSSYEMKFKKNKEKVKINMINSFSVSFWNYRNFPLPHLWEINSSAYSLGHHELIQS